MRYRDLSWFVAFDLKQCSIEKHKTRNAAFSNLSLTINFVSCVLTLICLPTRPFRATNFPVLRLEKLKSFLFCVNIYADCLLDLCSVKWYNVLVQCLCQKYRWIILLFSLDRYIFVRVLYFLLEVSFRLNYWIVITPKNMSSLMHAFF